MNHNISCPCCSSSMLRHISNRRSFWFCNHCRFEMPDVNNKRLKKSSTIKTSFSHNSLKDAIANSKSIKTVPVL